MCTMTAPKSSSTQCDAAVPSRPIGADLLVPQRLDDAVGDRVELALRAARADDEIVGQRRQRAPARAARCRRPSCPRPARRSDGRGRAASRSARLARRLAGSPSGSPSALGRDGVVGQRGFGHDRSVPPVVAGTGHGRRYRPRPHPARGSGPNGRPRRARRISDADKRGSRAVEERERGPRSRELTRARNSGSASA